RIAGNRKGQHPVRHCQLCTHPAGRLCSFSCVTISISFMIEIKDLKKTFGDKTVIDGVSAVMQTGKCNLIIGSSGSGKTVFMKCLVGLFEPDSGEILYSGKNFTTMN